MFALVYFNVLQNEFMDMHVELFGVFILVRGNAQPDGFVVIIQIERFFGDIYFQKQFGFVPGGY